MPDSTTPSENPEMTGILGEKIAQEALARGIYGYLTPDFTRVELEYSAVGPVSQAILRAFRLDGSKTSFPDIPGIDDPVEELRSAMYREGAGTWLSMKMSVTAEGSMDASFNYDDHPESGFEYAPSAYRADLEQFPRDDAHIPGWLREKLDEDGGTQSPQ
jgi:Protein of unknown function, DUF600